MGLWLPTVHPEKSKRGREQDAVFISGLFISGVLLDKRGKSEDILL
jgi:hypothetical protein